MANFLKHEPCDKCGSSDAKAVYDNGSAHCFACEAHWHAGDSKASEPVERDWTPIQGDYRELTSRGISKETCRFWQYQVTLHNGEPAHVANYRDAKGHLVCQKLRTGDKKFPTLGKGKNKPLYGQWLWGSGKYIVITEGELDALSVSQAFENKWPVVSLPDGASSAEAALAQAYEYLDQFENIILMFDMDDPGREAVEKAAAVLPVGKVKVAALPEKDANEVLKKLGPGPIVKAFWNATPWRPDGIVAGSDFTLERLKSAVSAGFSIPYPALQGMSYGLRKGEITLITAGSGIGKSTWARELGYHLHQAHGLRIGNVFLEENNTKTAQGYIAIHNNVPLGKLRYDPAILTDEQWREGLHSIIHERMWFYDHFGSLESKNLLTKLRYLAVVCKVDFIILDHISIVTSGIESSSEGERKDIDILMTRLRSLAEETGVGIIAIVHLKRAQGKTFNEGDQISLNDLRGSASLEQLSDNVYGLERDQQDEEQKDYALIRSLKIRETGDTGEADRLLYDRRTGRLLLADLSVF